MKPVGVKFDSFKAADEADRAYYRQLTPAQRLAIMLELNFPEGNDAASARLERVYRIVKFGKS